MTINTTPNYGLSIPVVNTEIDIWGTPVGVNFTTIDTQLKLNADLAAAASSSAAGKAPLVHTHAAADIISGTFAVARMPAYSGDVSSSVGTTTLTLTNNAVITAKIADGNVTNAKLANMAANTIKGSVAGGAPIDLTPAQASAIIGFASGYAPINSPAFTGIPTTATTPAPGDNTLKLATTAFVQTAVTPATAVEIASGVVTDKIITPANAAAANNEVTLTDGATVTVNFAAGINFALTIAGNRTLAASGLSAALIGKSGYIKVTQDAIGSRTLDVSGATWKHINQENTVLSTGAGQIDYMFYTIISASTVFMSLARNVG